MLDLALVTGALAAMDAAAHALRAAASPDGHNPPTPLFAQQLALILEHGGLLMREAAAAASAQRQRRQPAAPKAAVPAPRALLAAASAAAAGTGAASIVGACPDGGRAKRLRYFPCVFYTRSPA